MTTILTKALIVSGTRNGIRSVGFYKQGDIRTAVYYGILLEELDRFKKAPTSQYRFSVERCEQEMKSDGAIFKF